MHCHIDVYFSPPRKRQHFNKKIINLRVTSIDCGCIHKKKICKMRNKFSSLILERFYIAAVSGNAQLVLFTLRGALPALKLLKTDLQLMSKYF